MNRIPTALAIAASTVLALGALAAIAQLGEYRPVTTEMLANPDAADWLSFSRTLDAQRFSPLDQIDKDNVGDLKLAWSRGLRQGPLESIPLVYDGVMYMLTPSAVIQAVDARNGDLIWEFQPPGMDAQSGSAERSKTLAIYDDVLLLSGPDRTMFGIDAVTGELRWQNQSADNRNHTSGPIVAGA